MGEIIALKLINYCHKALQDHQHYCNKISFSYRTLRKITKDVKRENPVL
jgi:hypothetical protein